MKRKMFISVGLECPNKPPSVADFLKFVHPHVKRLNSLEYTQVMNVDGASFMGENVRKRVAGGVYGFLCGTQLKLFAPGFVKKKWEIVAPIDDNRRVEDSDYCLCPSVNKAAFAQLKPK